MKIKGAICDVDGTLINMEGDHYLSLSKALERFGVTLDLETYSRDYSGLPGIVKARKAVETYNLPIIPEELERITRDNFTNVLKNQSIHLMDGAKELVVRLHDAEFKLAIASGDKGDATHFKLNQTGLDVYFPVVVSGDDIRQGKPNPEIFLLAARKLGLDPRDCIAFEDTQAGVDAAKAAGMFVIAIPNETTKWQDFSNADKVFDNAAQAAEFIKSVSSTKDERIKRLKDIIPGVKLGGGAMKSSHPEPEVIPVAVVGPGNCMKSFWEAVAFYTKNPDDPIGLSHPTIGGIHISQIKPVAAFGVDERQVGYTLTNALNAPPNNTMKIADILPYDVIVQRGPTLDSIIPETREFIHESPLPPVDVAAELKKSGAKVVICAIPTGSDKAVYAYAKAALEAGCSFINCIPTQITFDPEIVKAFEEKGLVILGNDMKSQMGASVLCRGLVELLQNRGVVVTKVTQVNHGGNADHQNLHYRPESKERSKESAIGSAIKRYPGIDVDVSARMEYTPENYDKKEAYIVIEGLISGHIPVKIELKLTDQDSPNIINMYFEAIVGAYILAKEGRANEAERLCSRIFKDPIKQRLEQDALKAFDEAVASHEKTTLMQRIREKPAFAAIPIAASLLLAAGLKIYLDRKADREALVAAVENCMNNPKVSCATDMPYILEFFAGSNTPIAKLSTQQLREISEAIKADTMFEIFSSVPAGINQNYVEAMFPGHQETQAKLQRMKTRINDEKYKDGLAKETRQWLDKKNGSPSTSFEHQKPNTKQPVKVQYAGNMGRKVPNKYNG